MASVLVVDDDTDLLEMVCTVLNTKGMEVHCISQGRAFFNSVSSVRPDIILMDIYLDDLDGRNLCYSLKTSGDFQQVPVILYSAGVITPASVEKALADDFMVKPFNISQLMSKISALIPKG